VDGAGDLGECRPGGSGILVNAASPVCITFDLLVTRSAIRIGPPEPRFLRETRDSPRTIPRIACLVFARVASLLEALPLHLQSARLHTRGPNIVGIFLFASQSQHGIRTRCASRRKCRSCQCQQQHCDGGKCKHTRIKRANFKEKGTQQAGCGHGAK
jgi:hypothetical protein